MLAVMDRACRRHHLGKVGLGMAYYTPQGVNPLKMEGPSKQASIRNDGGVFGGAAAMGPFNVPTAEGLKAKDEIELEAIRKRGRAGRIFRNSKMGETSAAKAHSFEQVFSPLDDPSLDRPLDSPGNQNEAKNACRHWRRPHRAGDGGARRQGRDEGKCALTFPKQSFPTRHVPNHLGLPPLHLS